MQDSNALFTRRVRTVSPLNQVRRAENILDLKIVDIDGGCATETINISVGKTGVIRARRPRFLGNLHSPTRSPKPAEKKSIMRSPRPKIGQVMVNQTTPTKESAMSLLYRPTVLEVPIEEWNVPEFNGMDEARPGINRAQLPALESKPSFKTAWSFPTCSRTGGSATLPPLQEQLRRDAPRRRERDGSLPRASAPAADLLSSSKTARKAVPVLAPLDYPSSSSDSADGDSVETCSAGYHSADSAISTDGSPRPSPRPFSPYVEDSPRGLVLLSTAVRNNFFQTTTNSGSDRSIE